jgi:hypothetical protein
MPRALIIDGPTLLLVMADQTPAGAKDCLLALSRMCRAVVGCRYITPMYHLFTSRLSPLSRLALQSVA